MTQAKTWKLLTLLSPPPPDRPCAVMISNPLLKKRVLVDRDVLMDLLADSFPADSDRSTAARDRLRELGFLADSPEDEQLLAEIQHWQRRGWDPALDYYLWSRSNNYADIDPDPEIRRQVIRKYLDEHPVPEELPFPHRQRLAEPGPLPEHVSLGEVAIGRRTVRRFAEQSLDQLTFSTLLWHGLQSVRKVRQLESQDPLAYLVSFGVAFDFYLALYDVEGLEAGIYRYSVREHEVGMIVPGDWRETVAHLLFGQTPPLSAAFTLFIVADFPRYGWRYRHERALRNLYMDAGRVGHGLILLAWALQLGTFPTPAVRDRETNQLLQLDENRQGVIYTLTFGWLPLDR